MVARSLGAFGLQARGRFVATALALSFTAFASCATDPASDAPAEGEGESESLPFESSEASSLTFAQAWWPVEATSSWTYRDVNANVETTTRIAMNGSYGTVTGLPGVSGSLVIYGSGGAMWAKAGTTYVKWLDFDEAVGTTRVLPTTLPAGIAGSTLRVESKTFSLYDHLNGRNFTGCTRFVLTPTGTADGVTELVFSTGLGPVLVKVRVAGTEHWWFVKTATTSQGAVVVPSYPVVPPRSEANLRSLLPGLGSNQTPPWRDPSFPPSALPIDAAIDALTTEHDAVWSADDNVTIAFDQQSIASGYLMPTELLGTVFDPAYWVDLGPAAWSPEVLATYPNLPQIQAKADLLATLNNQIAEARAEAGRAQTQIKSALDVKYATLKKIKQISVQSLEFEQARYRREIIGLWVGFALDVVGIFTARYPVMVTTKVVARLWRPVGSLVAGIRQARTEIATLEPVLEFAKRANNPELIKETFTALAVNEITAATLTSELSLYVAGTWAGGYLTGTISLAGKIWRYLSPNEVNPYDVAITELETGVAQINTQLATARGKRDAALARARSLQIQYDAAFRTPAY